MSQVHPPKSHLKSIPSQNGLDCYRLNSPFAGPVLHDMLLDRCSRRILAEQPRRLSLHLGFSCRHCSGLCAIRVVDKVDTVDGFC